ncbi:hypothetical protein SeMB42_g04078 [Synchytrium endobioticum]|uniref:Uncharacterized protein n=2 Tax=Synchytrium endobioticum TaxID=286115 RepID=A0A507D176_9FUNG|nr:hypothetical protein SeMB42_g04078 [Synchytrium endobioticum]
MSQHFRIRPRCCSIKMGKNIKIVAVATLLIFFTLTQAAPPPITDDRIQRYLESIAGYLHPLLDKMPLVEQKMTDTSRNGENYRSSTYRDVFHIPSETRFGGLKSPAAWLGHTYNSLANFFNTDNRWMPVCLAHEYLVIARALYDMKRLHYYTEYCKLYQVPYPASIAAINQRSSLYRDFVSEHVDIKNGLMQAADQMSPTMVGLAQYVEGLLSELASTGGTSASTGHVDRQTQNLFEQHRQDATTSVTVDYLRRFREPQFAPPPSHHVAAEYYTPIHDNRNSGTMAMHDDSSAPSYPDYSTNPYSQGSLDGWGRRQ